MTPFGKERAMFLIKNPMNGEIDKACSMIERAYRDKGYIKGALKGRPSVLFVAIDSESKKIVGTVGLHIGQASEPLPTETFFDFDLGVRRTSYVEITRLMSTMKGKKKRRNVVEGLLCAIWWWCDHYGKDTAIACIKPDLMQSLADRLKVGFTLIPGKLHLERIPPEYGGYFRREPLPMAVSVSLTNVRPSMQTRFLELRESDTMRFELASNGRFDFITNLGSEAAQVAPPEKGTATDAKP